MKKYDLQHLTVLVVDRQPLMRRLMRDVLNQLGVPAENIELTSDIDTAYDLYATMHPDIVLTDWAPLLDGIEFIKKVRNPSKSPNPYVPIIVVTAFSELDSIVQARDSGMTEFLIKPISAKMLYLRICSVIERERLFVRSSDFFGPDRRRRRHEFHGIEKRTYGNISGPNRRKIDDFIEGRERRQGYSGYTVPDDRDSMRA